MKTVESDLVLISHPGEERFSLSSVFLHIYSLQAWSIVLSEQCLIEALGSITQTSSGFITRDVTSRHITFKIYLLFTTEERKSCRCGKSKWWQNWDFWVNYGFRVLGCYATFLLRLTQHKKKKCAWFWWMCTCSII